MKMRRAKVALAFGKGNSLSHGIGGKVKG